MATGDQGLFLLSCAANLIQLLTADPTANCGFGFLLALCVQTLFLHRNQKVFVLVETALPPLSRIPSSSQRPRGDGELITSQGSSPRAWPDLGVGGWETLVFSGTEILLFHLQPHVTINCWVAL